MFRILKYVTEQMEKEERKKARREAVKHFFAGLGLSVLFSALIGGIFTLVGYVWFIYIESPTQHTLMCAVLVSVGIFLLQVGVGLAAWYSGDDEDVD